MILYIFLSFTILFILLICTYLRRGEWIVPNFEEIWPSGKPRRKGRGKGIPTKGIGYIEHAMVTGIPGERDKDFTTVGKPKVMIKIS